MSSFEDFRYDFPVVYRISVTASIAAVIAACISFIPNNEFSQAIGLTAFRESALNLREAIYWETRAKLNPGAVLTPNIEYGFVVGIDFDSGVFVSVPEKKEFVQHKLKLADVKVTNLNGVAEYINQRKQMDARLETYGDAAVIWIEDKPINVDLINKGMAIPDPNPPTNIVDRVFAEFYWNKLQGGKKE